MKKFSEDEIKINLNTIGDHNETNIWLSGEDF